MSLPWAHQPIPTAHPPPGLEPDIPQNIAMGQESSEASGPSLPDLRPAFPAGVHMVATAVCLDSSSGGLGGSASQVVLSSPLAKTPAQSPLQPEWGYGPQGVRMW